MNIKTISGLILAFFFLSNTIHSQRIKDKAVNLKFIELPEKQLPEDYKTYSVSATGPLFSQAGSSATGFAKSIKMNGFKRIDGNGENGGHLRVSIYGGRVYTGQIQAKTRTQKTKNKEGVEKTSYYYYYEVPFKCNTSFKVYDPNGNLLANGEYASDNVLKSREHGSTKSRASSRTRDIESIENKHSQSSMQNLKSGIYNGLNKRYDYRKNDDRMFIYMIRKHDSEERWEKHFDEVKTIFAEMNHTTKSEVLTEKLNPAMEFYEKYAAKDPRGDKKLKRIYKAANYNLAVLNFAIDQFEDAKTYARNVIKSEGKDRRSNNLIESIEKWEKKMEKFDIETIHFERDLSDALPPSTIAALEAEKKEIEANSTTTKGVVFMGKKEISGTWSLDKEAEDLVFGEGGNIKFIVEEGAEINEIDLTHSDVSSFKVAERKFEKVRFVPSAKGATEASVEILEEIYSSDRIKLYKFYPSTGALSDDKTEFAFQKTGQEHPISLESTMFLIWKKGLANYFSDCEDLADMASEGGFEKSKDSLLKAARVYTEICSTIIKP